GGPAGPRPAFGARPPMTTIGRASNAASDALAVLAGGELRDSTVWEDHPLLDQGLHLRSGHHLLLIAGAGDKVRDARLRQPRGTVAIDVNAAQIALAELQVAAISSLDHAAVLQLLGWIPAPPEARVGLSERVRFRLGETSRVWWDDRVPTIETGVV